METRQGVGDCEAQTTLCQVDQVAKDLVAKMYVSGGWGQVRFRDWMGWDGDRGGCLPVMPRHQAEGMRIHGGNRAKEAAVIDREYNSEA